jgi:hypothetical protein
MLRFSCYEVAAVDYGIAVLPRLTKVVSVTPRVATIYQKSPKRKISNFFCPVAKNADKRNQVLLP